MKEHKETKSAATADEVVGVVQPGSRVLKSLLKKPGEKRSKSQKNRVVINEKMNEFFAADYIILIKEECCADYEEECDCCCQEHEMIRLGNCKECRAELNLRFNRDDDNDDDDDDDDSEDVDSEDVDEDEHDHTMCGRDAAAMVQVDKDKPLTPARRQQQRETLSPPEGYKDLCVAAQAQQELDDQDEVCAECDYYQRQAEAAAAAAAATAASNNSASSNDAAVTATAAAAATNDEKSSQKLQHDNRNDEQQQHQANGAQPTIDHAQQTTPDVQQRYLVETITMTTVTERRIVREISEEESRPANSNASIDEADHPAIESSQNETPKNGELKSDSEKPAELTLAFKLASNSLKPNSAVRQLFPDPRFISPPPAPVKSVSSDLEDSGMDDGEGQKMSSDGLRMLDASGDSSIKRTIERNALRRSLCKYDTGSLKKKSLKSKDLSLEERIRQLTCVDDDEDATDTSVSENNNSGKLITNHHHNNNNSLGMNGLMTGRTIGEGEDHLLMPMHQLPARTSPSGEERPKGHVVQSHHHHHHNSAYKKITDLFGPKKNNSNAELNLPDIGLGAKQTVAMKSSQKLSSEARKQFLASLAPLSCVGSSGVDGRDDYYRMPSKPGDRNSMGYNSDSSYSLEDIEDALQEGIPAPPDVTRGTPTSAGPSLDSFGQDASDELLAFVEQEKTRTERIKRRYDVEEKRNDNLNNDSSKNSITAEEDDEDDELNDYGFNRRPSVRGIKAQFETTNEIVRQLRSRSAAATSLPEACRLNFPSAQSIDDDSASSSSDMYHLPYGADPSTVSRINSMQKQINEIYQSITEGGVNLLEPSRPATSLSYLESTLPRTMMPQDHRHNGTLRMLRMTGGDGTTAPLGVYSTLPKPHRHPTAGYSYVPAASAAAAAAAAVANPAASAAAAAAAAAVAGAKCYRTMYFVPYNGMTDPTYQNLQRILPPHNASPTNYAEHVERYPYPRNGRIEQGQQPRYYVRPASIPNTQAGALHLHLHQAEEFRLQQQQQQQAIPMSSQQVQSVPVVPPPPSSSSSSASQQYSVQTLSGESYSICPPPPPSQTSATYTYQMQIQGRLSASDMPTPTSIPATSQLTSSLLSGANLLANSSLGGSISSGSSSLLSSPTKLPAMSNMGSLQRNSSCSVAERGVPEGAASAPSHDYASGAPPSAGLLATTTQTAASIAATFVGGGGGGDNASAGNIVDAQNPVYYAMNV